MCVRVVHIYVMCVLHAMWIPIICMTFCLCTVHTYMMHIGKLMCCACMYVCRHVPHGMHGWYMCVCLCHMTCVSVCAYTFHMHVLYMQYKYVCDMNMYHMCCMCLHPCMYGMYLSVSHVCICMQYVVHACEYPVCMCCEYICHFNILCHVCADVP